MHKTKLHTPRGDVRPSEFRGPFGTVRFTNNTKSDNTDAIGPTGIHGVLEYGPSKPGPFGEVIGLIDDSKVVFRYLPWGSVEPGRHAFEVRYEGAEYVLASRGRRPTAGLEALDGSVLATFGARGGKVSDRLTPAEYVLVALVAASGLAEVTLPQSWMARH